MSNLAVVAYPLLREDDRRWIEAFRARHDPQASRIPAHFTLVFPEEMADVAGVAAHAVASLEGFRRFPFVVRRAEAVRDPLGEGAQVFLVPDEGHAEIVALHDRLYEDRLRPFLRADIPFVPHVTVAASDAFEACAHLARELNKKRPPLRGSVQEIEVIEVLRDRVRRVTRVRLDGPEPLWG
jgi:2'-5' RNA ligase